MARSLWLIGIVCLGFAAILSFLASVSVPLLTGLDITRVTVGNPHSTNTPGVNDIRFGICRSQNMHESERQRLHHRSPEPCEWCRCDHWKVLDKRARSPPDRYRGHLCSAWSSIREEPADDAPVVCFVVPCRHDVDYCVGHRSCSACICSPRNEQTEERSQGDGRTRILAQFYFDYTVNCSWVQCILWIPPRTVDEWTDVLSDDVVILFIYLFFLAMRRLLSQFRRLFTPSRRNDAPALAMQTRVDHSLFTPTPSSPSHNMKSFLGRRPPYTILPTPLPDDKSSPLNEMYFTRSPTQDLLSVMDACLYNLYDVPRAKQIFERLRNSQTTSGLLDSRLYNAFLQAYLDMASTKDMDRRDSWVKDACTLFDIMEDGIEKVMPTPSTYAIMLLIWLRFNPESHTPVNVSHLRDPQELLTSLDHRELSVSLVVSDRVFSSSEEAVQVIRLLSKAAVELNLSHIVTELSKAEAIGRSYADPHQDVPEVQPVTRSWSQDVDPSNTPVDGTTGPPSQDFVPFNLSNLRKHLAQVVLARRVLPEDTFARQKLLEDSVYDVAVERWRHQAGVFENLGLANSGLNHADLQTWMWGWHQKLQGRLEEEIRQVINHEADLPPHTTRLGPFLSLVKPEKLSLLTILAIMRLQGTGGVADGMKTTRGLLAVGKAVELEYKSEMCRKNNIHIPNHIRTGEQGYFTRYGYCDLQSRRMAARKYMEDAEEWTSEWTQLMRIRIGSILVNCLMEVSTVTRSIVDKRTDGTVSEVQPAFFHGYEYVRGQKLGVIKLNPEVAERLGRDGLRETLHPRHLPMLVKPKPWLDHDQGGYLYSKSQAMRYKDCLEQQTYLKQASANGNVELVYAGLDVLGSTPWKINRKVFDVVLKVWNSGERVCKIPPAVFDQPAPEKPENLETDVKARSVYIQRQKAYVQNRSNNHSERCNVNYKIEIARAFLGDTFYLPHNLDFRGRAYPIPPLLNHIGDDLSRGLLMFGEGKPLGKRGLWWVKIHLANLAGFDKGSFDERVEFVHKHMEDIYDSAERPLDGKRWWMGADDPWQCLATCMELRAALESGDPQGYVSCLPVHQDGTCNGLQHYAALGGDDQGARQVNLSVTDRPSDVYTYVADMVERLVEADRVKGNRYGEMLAGKIARKVVKQTVMTTVYGVTFVGARAQIEKQIKDRGDVPEEECWGAASYLAKKVLHCIGDLFSGAKGIQIWLNLCARLIAKSMPEERIPHAVQRPTPKRGRAKNHATDRMVKEQMTSVVWTTPLGLPIVQPYRKTKRKQIQTPLQTVYLSDPNSPAEVNSMKQASAFPPNFIHSLDATHMMLTALECKTKGLTFASVHDSYWTHACSVDEMSTIIRDTFIALHSSDVLGRLQIEFRERYKGFKVPVVQLKSMRLLKQLRDAGHPLNIPQLLWVNEETGTETTTLSENEEGSALDDEVIDDHNDDLTDVVASEPENDRGNDKPAKSPRRRRSKKEIEADVPHPSVQDRFVSLVDLLPPLPKKGDFKVETIKRSQYFFS